MKKTLFILFFFGAGVLSGLASAQQIHATTPMQRNGSSFSESIGCNWGLSGKNWSLNVGSPQANNLPRYGNYDMNGGMRTGFQFQHGGTTGYFNGWAGQSYSGYNTVEAPSVTFMNGQRAYFENVTETPFVVSTIPVVGGWQNGAYQPYYDPQVTASPSVLQQKIERLNEEKKKPRYVRETPNAPALKEVEPPSRSSKKTARATASVPKSTARDRYYTRSSNPDTAETPALSVAEMKRRRATAERNGETRP